MTSAILLLSLALAAPAAGAADSTATTATATSPAAPARRFALVIGSNAAPDERTPGLRFADDDAARVAELLREAGVDVELVAEFDQDTQAVHGAQVAGLRPPTREGALQAHAALVARMKAARAAGAAVEYLVYFSGHGDIGPDGQGFLAMSEGTRLTRHDLFAGLLAGSPADYNHLVLDACQSEALVLSRGGSRAGWKSDRVEGDGQAVQKYLDGLHLDRFPNTGVLLASSADQQTHEWERYRGGIFTHELLSALRGAGDVNGDGRLEYSEVGAFVAAANSGVKDPRGRLRVVVRPPRRDVRRPLLAHELGGQRLLVFAAGDAHRYTVEDSRGVRLADLRRSGELPGYLRLPPGELFVVREREAAGEGAQAGAQRPEEARVPANQSTAIAAARLKFAAAARGERGALDQALRGGLFTVPYGRGYYVGYTDRTGLLAVEHDQWAGDAWQSVEARAEHERMVGPPPPPPPVTPTPTGPPEVEWEDKYWNAMSVGVIFSPFREPGPATLASDRVTADQSRAWASPFRGLDVRYYAFELGGDRFPRFSGFVRTGFNRGSVQFSPAEGATGFMPTQARELDYFVVPLWLGGNFHLFRRFPLRPYAGFGFGFDILHVDYAREAAANVVNTSARIGFEVHAGLEVRISNYFFASAQIQQQWAARKRLAEVPDFSTQGLSVITSIGFGFPINKANAALYQRRQKRAQEQYQREQQAAADRARRAAEAWEARPVQPELLSPRPAAPPLEGPPPASATPALAPMVAPSDSPAPAAPPSP
ncbi:caspase family protein [Nannocystis punicea]|uniref:Caspase family protein n=1 Tax=Nannocystis punicea TaxID=2995304 RepID=A0ABY7H976_9BACT|nr:caspase family protein [Nannocystis poenicansa]WAS95826.1 caspase family protein [Nannocystis poenicansa]